MDTLGRLIRDARSHKGLTQEALARLLSTSRTTIQYVEGGYRNGSLEMLDSIHRALSPDEPITAWVLASLERARLSLLARSTSDARSHSAAD